MDDILLKTTDKCYWTYEGSLTTPPLYESVTWIVMKEPIVISKGQLESFRGVCSHRKGETPTEGDGRVAQNYRPTQPIHDRCVTFDRNA